MKKIFDWTLGSFFRTIGRAIAFFVMAMLVYYLLSYNDIDFGIKNLFFDKVEAETWKTNFVGDIKYNGQNLDFNTNYLYDYVFMNAQNGVPYDRTLTFTTIVRDSNTYGVKINGFFEGIDMKNQEITCTETNSNGQCIEWSMPNDVMINFNMWFGGNTYQCDISWNTLPGNNWTYDTITWTATCPWDIRYGQSDRIRVQYQVYNNSNITYKLNFNRNFTIIQNESQSIIDNQNQNTQSIINSQNQNTQAIANQTQQQQQQHQETMNSSTTDAENDASSFFGNFTVEDQGGLSAIVTAPLNTIRSLLSSTCADLVLPLPFVEEDLTLPCMYSIYSQHFGAFFSLYQTIILGIIAYRCIMSIFFDIKGFTNPNDDRIEVMDL